jgi:hypothetical protein
MKDYSPWQLAPLLHSYRKIPEFQEKLLETSTILLSFLKEHKLLKSDRFINLVGNEKDFEIKFSELTEKGQQLFDDGHVDRWLDANDDIRKPITTRRLETGLRKILLSGTV